MKKLFILIFIVPTVSFGYTGTIQKIKGTRAIVEFERNAKIHEGDMVSSESESGGTSKTNGKYQNREYSLGYSFSYANRVFPSPTSITSNRLDMNLQFGFNFTSFEIGPILTYSNSQTSNSSTGTTLYGIYGQYNFIPNKAGAVWVPYVGAKYTAYSDGQGTNETYMGGYGGLQWFPIGNNVSLQLALQYGQVTSTGVTGRTEIVVTTSPILGPVIYF